MAADFEAHTIVVRKGGLPSTPVDADLVILNLATNNYVGLDDIGRSIWELLEKPLRVAELCQLMTEKYTGTREEIERDVVLFLRELSGEGLVDVSQG